MIAKTSAVARAAGAAAAPGRRAPTASVTLLMVRGQMPHGRLVRIGRSGR